MHRNLLIPFALLAISCIAPASAQESEARKLATEACASCHGPRGESISPAFPRLAGQPAEYLEGQLKAFRDRTRADPMAQAYMWGMTSQLNDDTIKRLSAYYSAQKPLPGKTVDAKLVQQGKVIYEAGVPGANVQACVTCHGKNAEGNASFPRLAGQHAEYLVKQLVLFKSLLRAGSNAPIMHNISAGMSFEQMEAVSAYLMSR
ncbi:MAG: cytochrome c4 [Betaproteobacteria bacterium]|nr:cytochrome c4 [Betaproteobacteria bacterium]